MFDGSTYDSQQDGPRLGKQLEKVYNIMRDANWRTLPEIQNLLPEATTQSISARLRDFRKPKFGGFLVERRRVEGGLFEYRLDIEKSNPVAQEA